VCSAAAGPHATTPHILSLRTRNDKNPQAARAPRRLCTGADAWLWAVRGPFAPLTADQAARSDSLSSCARARRHVREAGCEHPIVHHGVGDALDLYFVADVVLSADALWLAAAASRAPAC